MLLRYGEVCLRLKTVRLITLQHEPWLYTLLLYSITTLYGWLMRCIRLDYYLIALRLIFCPSIVLCDLLSRSYMSRCHVYCVCLFWNDVFFIIPSSPDCWSNVIVTYQPYVSYLSTLEVLSQLSSLAGGVVRGLNIGDELLIAWLLSCLWASILNYLVVVST